jgi:hypothetical protein
VSPALPWFRYSRNERFGLLFWQLDEGGPRLRAERGRPDPDFQFPQDAVRRADWSPRLSDYLYVSLTNAIAVSPTDTMPLGVPAFRRRDARRPGTAVDPPVS